MIVLDTNVVSEVMKPSPDESVIEWFNQQESANLFITSITIAEISYGLNALPQGNRRATLEEAFINAVNEAFNHRTLYFDTAAAYEYGKVMAHRKSCGRPLSICDGQIIAITRVHGYKVATRNTNDFLDCSVKLINPFER